MTVSQHPVAQHPNDEPCQAAMNINGYPLRRYDGTWCGQTLAGTWRPVWWLRRWPDALLDVIYQTGAHTAPPGEAPIADQQPLGLGGRASNEA